MNYARSIINPLYLIPSVIIFIPLVYKIVKELNRSNITYQDSEYINKLIKNKNVIKEQLTLRRYCNNLCTHFDLNHFRLSEYKNCNHDYWLCCYEVYNVHSFFNYCYYINLHAREGDIREILSRNESNDSYKETHDGRSAITAVILSEFVSISKKRRFISRLLSYGFTITDNDRLFASLEIYIKSKNNILTFLNTHDLLPEIKLYIVNMLIKKYKIEYDPLYIL